jgi:choline kinase
MKAVMLAAGDGGRLGAHTRLTPKPLVSINGRPIADYTLEALATAGVSDVVVVTGYREEQVRAGLRRAAARGTKLTFVTNHRFEAGASLSLRAARPACGTDPFLLVMSDHLLSESLICRLLRQARLARPGVSLVAADSCPRDAIYADEATKLAIDGGGYVTAIGKDLAAWSAFDTGAFFIAPAAWEAVDSAPEDCELSVIFAALARQRRLGAADVSGAFWYDVDTADDLAAASVLLAAAAGA